VLASFDRGECDAVIVRREGEGGDGTLLAEERLG